MALGVFLGLSLHPSDLSNTAISSAVLSLLMWLYFNWQSDWIQKDPGRIIPPLFLWISPLIIAILLCFLRGGGSGIIGVFIYSLTIILYSLKAKHKRLGTFGPLFRAISIFGQLAMIAFYFNQVPDIKLIIIVIFIAIYMGIRNLIGDIRDIRTDKWEIPAMFGSKVSLVILRVGFLTIFSMTFFLEPKNISIISTIFVIISWCALEILAARFKESDFYLFGYWMHKFLIITISSYFVVMANFMGLSNSGTSILFLILILFQPFYKLLPGKNYPNFKTLYSHL